jgi:hypothetical protein
MGLIVNMSSADKKKSIVTLKQDTRKFLNENIYPYIASESSFEAFEDFLKEEIHKGKKTWDEKYYEEEQKYNKLFR